MSPAAQDLSALLNPDFLYQEAPSGLLSFDVKGKIYRVNRTFLRWTGLNEQECLDSPFISLLTPGGVLYYQMVVNSLLHLHGVANEISLTFKSEKGNFDALFNAVAHKNDAGEILIINVTIQKITDRKKYETELLLSKQEAQEERRKVEFLLDSLPIMIWTTRPDGHVNYVNQRVKDNFGALAIGDLSYFMSLVDEEPGTTMAYWLKCLETGENFDKELSIIKEDGTYEWFVVKIEPYKNKQGIIELWLGSSMSIHNKKMAQLANQSALRNNLSSAHQTIAQNKNQFNKIAFNQSHMIRKPLANMMGLLPLLNSEPLTAEGKLVLELIQLSTGELDSMIKDIVAHTKI